jgi:hypothetical protein
VNATFEDRLIGRGGAVVSTRTSALPDGRMKLQTAAGAAAVKGATAQGERAFAGPDLGISVTDPLYRVVEVQPPPEGPIAVVSPRDNGPQSTYVAAREVLIGVMAGATPGGSASIKLIDNSDAPWE